VKLSPSAPFWRPTDAVSLRISFVSPTPTPVPGPPLFCQAHCLLRFGSNLVMCGVWSIRSNISYCHDGFQESMKRLSYHIHDIHNQLYHKSRFLNDKPTIILFILVIDSLLKHHSKRDQI